MNQSNSTPWPAVFALAVVYIAVIMDWNGVWGILFLMWVAPGLVLRETHLVVLVRRQHNPILYWLIMGSWIGLSLLLIAWDTYRFIWSEA